MIAHGNKKIILLFSSGMGIWSLYQIFVEQQYLQGGILLAYFVEEILMIEKF